MSTAARMAARKGTATNTEGPVTSIAAALMIEYSLSQVNPDSEGHGSSTTTLRETTVEKLLAGEPKYVNVHEAGTGNPPILTCAGLKEAG
jgi:hypothetical protein